MRTFPVLLLLFFSHAMTAQFWPHSYDRRPAQACPVDYDVIYDLQEKSDHIFYNTTLSPSKKIRLSRMYARQGLVEGYKAIGAGYCEDYSIIVDRMVELANRLGRHDEALALALTRLDTVYPGWKDYSAKVHMNPEEFEILVSLPKRESGSAYYRFIRKHGEPLAECGNYDVDILRIIRLLRDSYGNIYGFRYLQNRGLDINVVDSMAYQAALFDECIDSWSSYLPVSALLAAYEGAAVQRSEEPAYAVLGPAWYFMDIGGTRLYFCSRLDHSGRAPRGGRYVHPDAERVKWSSLFYRRLKARCDQ